MPIDNCTKIHEQIPMCEGKRTKTNKRTGKERNCVHESGRECACVERDVAVMHELVYALSEREIDERQTKLTHTHTKEPKRKTLIDYIRQSELLFFSVCT